MEAFAAQLSHADFEFGRILDTLQATGQLENTLIIVASDNGAGGEGGLNGTFDELRTTSGLQTSLDENLKYEDKWGGPGVHGLYAAGWAMAGNTPFRYFKQASHSGGVRVPLVISWGRKIADHGQVRTGFEHLIDIGPTVLEAAGVPAPRTVDGIPQQPIDGISFLDSVFDGSVPSKRRSQYFELAGNRGMYVDGWYAVTLHGHRMPWDLSSRAPFDTDVWELYDLRNDFSGRIDLAKQRPDKLAELQRAWDRAARKYNVYPLDDDIRKRLTTAYERSKPSGKHFELYAPGAYRIAEAISPPIKNRNHTFVAQITGDAGHRDGVIVAAGGTPAGYALYVENDVAIYEYNYFDAGRTRIVAPTHLPAGPVTVGYRYRQLQGFSARVELLVNDAVVASATVPHTVIGNYSFDETLDLGLDSGTPVSHSYAAPDTFRGSIHKAWITIDE
jgi:arylsulfatase